MTFDAWLAERHPDVRLTPRQAHYIHLLEKYSPGEVLWHGGLASGQTFVQNLWREYLEEEHA